MRNLIDILDFSVEEIEKLCQSANDIIQNPEMYTESCKGKILGTLFFEPSTRTRLSFVSAMMSLGGNVLGFSNSDSTSVAKGETLSDTIRMVAAYADIIVMRHPKEGAPIVASNVSSVPIINAGDGGHFHPTQTLTDLLTIQRKKGRFSDLTVGVCGDLKYGRTVHSLIAALTRYENVKFVLISPEELKLPDYVKDEFLKNSEFVEIRSLEEAIPELDILYMTRIQQERFSDKAEYERLKDSYVLTKAKLSHAKEDLSIMHPLPRVTEISTDVDDDKRADYFDQAKFGRYIRMALILKLLKESKREGITVRGEENESLVCKNPLCISKTERGIKKLFKGETCIYCDQKAQRK
ncbi:MAG: aspartate carbamoyltransferase [Clostridia bacterium]|nr:aspartate carbamoyltransferase [Clostridia bacterium]